MLLTIQCMFMPSLTISRQVFGLSFRPCVLAFMHDNRSLARYLTNRLLEFHHIYTLCAFGDNNELISFWGQKVEGHGHNDTTHGQISTYRDIRNSWTYLNETQQNHSLPGLHDTDDILKVMSWRVKVTENFSGRGILIESSPSKTIWYQLAFYSSSESRTVTDGLTVFSVTRSLKPLLPGHAGCGTLFLSQSAR